MPRRCPSERREKRRGRPPTREITEPQRSTLQAIRAFTAKRGFPPTMKELGDILGVAPASAHEQVNHLVRKGYLRREPRKARSIEIVEGPEHDVASLEPVPILGTVAAGQPLFAEENIVGELLVAESMLSGGRLFAIKVSGDSMVRAQIRGGDYVVVRQQPAAETGDLVVAILGGETTVKRLSVTDARIELRSENPRCSPIIIGPDDDPGIQGKVVAVLRKPPGEFRTRSPG